MSTATVDISGISKAISVDMALNHTSMVAQGIKYIEELGGKNWTNFNPSDPGIVLLENLCYLLLDLGYKSTFSMADLLTDKDLEIKTYERLYRPEEVLFTNPITINDFRKLLLDRVERIKNAWVNTVKVNGSFKGVFEVHFELDDAYKVQWLQLQRDAVQIAKLNTPDQTRHPSELKQMRNDIGDMRNGMEALLLQHRNLGELFLRPNMLLPREITLEGSIYLEKEAEVEQTLAWIYYQLNNYISEFIKFSTYDDLKAQGMTVGQIMSGPRMSRGYITDDQLVTRKTELDPQVMKASLMSNQDILSLFAFGLKVAGQDEGSGLDTIEVGKHESLFFDYSQVVSQLSASDTRLFIYHGEKRVTRIDQNRINTYYEQLTDPQAVISGKMKDELAPEMPEGNYREVKKYHSIQEVIPQSFGLSIHQTEDGYSVERLGQIKQLKAFVMLMEQVVADHQQQIASLPDLLSFKSGVSVGQPLCQTLFSQGLYDAPGAHWIIKAFQSYEVDNAYRDEYPHLNWENFKKDPFNKYQAFLDNSKAHEAKNIEHKSEVLTHLYARLGGEYNDTSLIQLNPQYDNYKLAQVENVSEFLKQFWLYGENMNRSYFRPEFNSDFLNGEARQFEKKYHLLFSGLEYKFGLTFHLNSYYKGIIDAVSHSMRTNDPYLDIEKVEITNPDGSLSEVWQVSYYSRQILSIPVTDNTAEQEILKHLHLLKLMCRQTRGFVLIDNLLLIKQLENQDWGIEKNGQPVKLAASGNSNKKNKKVSTHNLRQVTNVIAKNDWSKDEVVLTCKLNYRLITANSRFADFIEMENTEVRSDEALFDFSVNVMLPNWLTALNDEGFQNSFSKAFSKEGPVHLNYAIHQLDFDDMDLLMALRRPWMGLIKSQQHNLKLPTEELDYVGNMIALIKKLNPENTGGSA